MPSLNLKLTYKAIKDYCTALEGFARLGVRHEGAMRATFQGLLEHFVGVSLKLSATLQAGAQPSDRSSACSSTVCVAFSCLSGG